MSPESQAKIYCVYPPLPLQASLIPLLSLVIPLKRILGFNILSAVHAPNGRETR